MERCGTRHEDESDLLTARISDTKPREFPFPSSKDAMNWVPLEKGRNVTDAAPVCVLLFQASSGILIVIGLDEMGATVIERGNVGVVGP